MHFNKWFKNTTFILVLIFSSFEISLAQDSLLNKIVSISFNRITLNEAIQELQKVSQISFAYDPAIILNRRISAQAFSAQKVEIILQVIFNGTGLQFREVASSIVITRSPVSIRTINGIVYDAETGENLIGATLQINQVKGVTNQYGYYSISLPADAYTLTASYIGYETKVQDLNLQKNNYLSIGLKRSTFNMQEVYVTAPASDSIETLNSVKSISPSQLKGMPFYAGEADVIKALQMQSGVKNPSEGSSGLSIRGGNLDQNLVLVDEAPVYNPSHLFGLISIFNIDAIKKLQIYKDYIPANLGGRLSSVIDIKLEEGNLNDFHIKGGISLLSARFAAEGPFVKDKSSYLISFRRSLTDLYNSGFRFFNINANYYDFNFKTNYILNKSNRVYFSVYQGFDHLFTDNNYSNNWSNTTSTFRFNHIFNPRLFVNFSAIYSNYINALDITSLATINKEWLTGIRDLGLKGDFTFYKRAGNTIQFGVSGTRHHFRPGETADYISNLSLNRFRVNDYGAYFNQDRNLSPELYLNYGFRAGIFAAEEENRVNRLEKNKTVYNFEPRLQLQYSFNSNQALKISYMRNSQNLQLVQNNEISYSSFETWIPANSKVKQQQSDVFSTAYTHLVNRRYFIEVGLYYKKMYNQADLTDDSQIVFNPLFESSLRFGEGTAYGSEITFAKKTGRLTGELSYIYSRSFRKIMGINSGLKYPAIYDLPNDFKISGSYHFSNRLTVSTFFNYSNGRPVTLPVGFFTDNGSKVPIYEGRNSSRFPDYSRLDLVAELKPKIKENDVKKKFLSIWTFGIYNLYSRRNPLFYRVTQLESHRNIGFEESFSGVIPSISYSFKY